MAALPNHERAAEERRCMFRWLQRDFHASGAPTPEPYLTMAHLHGEMRPSSPQARLEGRC
jgi:hypothetical protein